MIVGMPCYHFTFHGYGTWMPDRGRGYVRRTRGLQPRDEAMGRLYRGKQREPAAPFERAHVELLFATAREAAGALKAVVHGTGGDRTHVHVAMSWEHERPWKAMRTSLRGALTRALNARFGKRTWFSDSPSRKRVRDHAHFDWLMLEYFPEHRWHWVREEDRAAAQRRAALQ